MGVRNFFKWLHAIGYKPNDQEYISVSNSLIVDVKTFMYRFGYNVPMNETANYVDHIANAIHELFRTFVNITFVNDGKLNPMHPKTETCNKRSVTRKRYREQTETKAAELTANPLPDKHQHELVTAKLDRAQRSARGVSFEQSVAIMHKLASLRPSYHCIQCEEEEADAYILQHSSLFDYVVSEDSDYVIGGVAKLVRNFGTKTQAVYALHDILTSSKLSLTQLQEFAAIVGNDYTQGGIPGLGLVKAHALLQEHGSLQQIVAVSPHIVVPADFYLKLNESNLLYTQKGKTKASSL